MSPLYFQALAMQWTLMATLPWLVVYGVDIEPLFRR